MIHHGRRYGGLSWWHPLGFGMISTRQRFALWPRLRATRINFVVSWSVAEIFDGGSRGDAARLGGVGLQTVRDWVLRFRAPRHIIVMQTEKIKRQTIEHRRLQHRKSAA